MEFDGNGLPIVNQFSADDFVDLVFRITNVEPDETTYRLRLLASHDEREVGVIVEMVKGIQGRFYEDENEDLQLVEERVYHNGVQFIRSGPESDELISVIAGLYGLDFGKLRMIEKRSFTAIALHEGELDFDSQRINIKLFANDGADCDEEDYFECFFNVDLANGFAYCNEKDQDYRRPLVNGLRSVNA